MRFRRRRSSRGRASPQRTREWLMWETIETGTGYHRPFLLGANQSSSNWLLDPDTCSNYYDEPTLVRLLIRTWAYAVPPSASTSFETHLWSGIIVARGVTPATGGILAVPAIDARRGDYDWLWWQSVHFSRLTSPFGVVPGIGELPASFGPYGGVIDIKTKRRIPQGHGLLYYNYVPNSPDFANASVAGYTSGRMLLLNH